MLPNRHGPGWAHGRLEARARMLERKGEDLTLARAIRVMLAWRSKVLTEKHGPPIDFSRPQSSSDGSQVEPSTTGAGRQIIPTDDQGGEGT